MKKSILALSLCAVLSIVAVGAPMIHVAVPVHDFGSVTEGIAVTHTFVVRNTGDEVLEISGVNASCGCTTADLASDSIAPGESVDLEVLVDTAGFGGTISKSIAVISNDPDTPTLNLRVAGQVQEADSHLISASDAHYLLYLLIDLRSVEEYDAYHFLGSVNMSSEVLTEMLIDLPHETFIILYDETGDLAEIAATALRNEGFTFVHTLLGGLNEWVRQYGMKNILGGDEEYDLPSRRAIGTENRTTYQLLANDLNDLFYLYVDVRTVDEYMAGHIMGAVNIPSDELESWIDLLPKGALMIIYDETGSLGDEAALWMIDKDFGNARSMLGGLDEWVRQYGTKYLSAESAKPAVAATTLVFFHEIGCSHCAHADAFLESIRPQYPELEILHYEISEPESLKLLAGLLAAYGVEQDSVPMIFVGDVAWIGGAFFGLYDEPYSVSGRAADATLESAIQVAIGRNATSPLDRIKGTDTSSLAEGLTIPAVIVAAAIDSVNPCTFAVLVLLLGTLIVAERRGKKGLVLKAGLAFTIAIYISYFLLGIGVFTAIQASGIQKPFIIAVSCLAILLGLWNMKDFFAYGKWFTIEVPKRWRPIVKRLTSSVVSVPGAFFVGVLDSLFLLPCSSGPYIAILALLSRTSSRTEGILYLLFYNLIFILPLLIITFAVHFGFTTTARAERWRSERLGKLHLASGILMFLLGAGMLAAVFMGWL